MTPPLLRLSGVARHYATGDAPVKALDGVSLDIHAGEFVAIMGQSGSGKTTLMNVLGCLDRPTSGTYAVHGEDVTAFDRDQRAVLRRKVFGFVYQRYNLLETASALENVELPAIYAGVGKAERESLARGLLETLGLEGKADNKPRALSGGQQQRVAIARALINDPDVILADEPTGALDSKSGEEVMALLARLNAQGRTIVLITHDPNVAGHARRLIRISDGKIVEDKGKATVDDGPNVGMRAKTVANSVLETSRSFSEIGEAVTMALRALRANIFRTFLTLLGIIIGVASVIVMLAIGDGSKQKVLDQITAMGTNIVMVRPGAPGMRPSGDMATLTREDAAVIAELDNVQAVSPERSEKMTLRRGAVDALTTVIGASWQQPAVNNWPVVEGSGMTEGDVLRMAPVAVIGKTVRENFFPYGENPIGKTIILKSVPFEVIGVMGPKGASMFGSDQDDVVFVPLTTGIARLFGRPFLSSIVTRVFDVAQISQTQEDIRLLLKDRHKKEDFSVRNMSMFIDMATETQNTLKILLGAVASISLLVGGIGVMNIMLVSVTERTREIGVRMATGAKTGDITLQFLTEATVVCVTGGLVGVALGIGVALGLDAFGMRAILTVLPVLVAFTCAVSTGLLFGYLPARKAATMDPVAALAAE